jgi:hypothetical protein
VDLSASECEPVCCAAASDCGCALSMTRRARLAHDWYDDIRPTSHLADEHLGHRGERLGHKRQKPKQLRGDLVCGRCRSAQPLRMAQPRAAVSLSSASHRSRCWGAGVDKTNESQEESHWVWGEALLSWRILPRLVD